MAQEFLVLKCFSCETFQVVQVKKTNKWTCKICNEKQSITKVYGRGNSSDCRKHVQKLNLARGEKDATERMYPADEYATTLQCSQEDLLCEDGSQGETLCLDAEGSLAKLPALVTSQNSRWTMYCEEASEPDEDVDCDGPFTTERAAYDVCKEVPGKRRRKKEECASPRPLTNDQSFDLIGENITGVITEGTYRKLEATGSPDVNPQPLYHRPYHHEEISKIKMDISQFGADNGGTANPPNASSRWSKYLCEQGGASDHTTQH